MLHSNKNMFPSPSSLPNGPPMSQLSSQLPSTVTTTNVKNQNPMMVPSTPSTLHTGPSQQSSNVHTPHAISSVHSYNVARPSKSPSISNSVPNAATVNLPGPVAPSNPNVSKPGGVSQHAIVPRPPAPFFRSPVGPTYNVPRSVRPSIPVANPVRNVQPIVNQQPNRANNVTPNGQVPNFHAPINRHVNQPQQQPGISLQSHQPPLPGNGIVGPPNQYLHPSNSHKTQDVLTSSKVLETTSNHQQKPPFFLNGRVAPPSIQSSNQNMSTVNRGGIVPPPNTSVAIRPPPSIHSSVSGVSSLGGRPLPPATSTTNIRHPPTMNPQQNHYPPSNDTRSESSCVGGENKFVVGNNFSGGGAPPNSSSFIPPYNSQCHLSRHLEQLSTNSNNNEMIPINLFEARQTQFRVDISSRSRPELRIKSWTEANCSTDIFCSTLNKVPESANILKKSRLPFGVTVHPFKDLDNLPVIQCANIVRCRSCRTYINPFVQFADQKRWRCNVCFRLNDLNDEFLHDPVSKTYGDPSRRPECRFATIEYVAPGDYMVRPPQPAVYIFCLEVTRVAVQSGYLDIFCKTLLSSLDLLPGDSRTQIAFLTFGDVVQFYVMNEDSKQARQMTVGDVDDIFVPAPQDILVNLNSCRSLIEEFLSYLPSLFQDSQQTDCALGSAVKAAYRIAKRTGGRVTLFQVSCPNIGQGASTPARLSDSNQSGNVEVESLFEPCTDFYKSLALECSAQQIGVDVFCLSNSFSDLASVSGISKFSSGQLFYFPSLNKTNNKVMAFNFESALKRYLSRKIGFEAVLRIRCTRGLSAHAFHGNFFVRSTDLLSLANVNPDATFTMQVSIEDDLCDSQEVVFQAALLYTTSFGERRIRVHTLCLPVSNSVGEIITSADQFGIVAMISKFATDRTFEEKSLNESRDGVFLSCSDILGVYKSLTNASHLSNLNICPSLVSTPLLIMSLARLFRKQIRYFSSTHNQHVADRFTYLFNFLKCASVEEIISLLYPQMYRIDDLTNCQEFLKVALDDDQSESDTSSDEDSNERERMGRNRQRHVVQYLDVPQPKSIPLSFEYISSSGVYLVNSALELLVFVGCETSPHILQMLFNVGSLQELSLDLPTAEQIFATLDNELSRSISDLLFWINSCKTYGLRVHVLVDEKRSRPSMIERMMEDQYSDVAPSYVQFLQRTSKQILKGI